MDPSSLVPAADAIPVHWLWFKVLLLLTFVLHILFMNLLLGGSLLAFLGHVGPGKRSWASADLSYRLPVISALTINMGVAPLLFLQVIYGNFIYVSSVLSAFYWLGVLVCLMAAYYGLYIYRYKYDALGGGRTAVTALVAALLLVIVFFFVNNMTLMVQPKTWLAYFKSPFGRIINWSDPTLFPRYLHFVTASLAVGGLFLAIVARYKLKRGDESAKASVDVGMNYFNWATVVQIGIGLWFLISLPQEVMLKFMGGSGYATSVFLIGLALTAGALIFGFKRSPTPTAAFLAGAVTFMALMRDIVRDAYLKPYHSLGSIQVSGQVSPLILFLATFVVGLVVLGYMFKIYFSAKKVG